MTNIFLLLAIVVCAFSTKVEAGTNASDADELLDKLMRQCRFLRSNQRPVEYAEETVQVEINLELVKFLGIDDTAQTMSIMAGIELYWPYPNCSSWRDMPEYDSINVLYLPLELEVGRLWTPKLLHSNNAQNMEILDNYFIQINEVELSRNGNGYIFAFGIFVSTCDLGSQLVRFPFDTQTCSLVFDPLWNNGFVNFTNGGFNPLSPLLGFAIVTDGSGSLSYYPSDFILADDIWQVTGVNHSQIARNEYFNSGGTIGYNFNRITYSLTLRRNPTQYIYDIFAPCWALMIVQLGGFAMPPRFPERPLFSATIVLVFSVIQTSVSSMIPRVSETLLIKVFIVSQIAIGAAATFYFIVSSHFANYDLEYCQTQLCELRGHASTNTKKVETWNAIRVADAIAFVVTLIATGAVNIIVFPQMMNGGGADTTFH